jgi:hypothetical protein
VGRLLLIKPYDSSRRHSYQECALPTELCGPPALYNGGGRIRTHVARTGGRFTVCSD